MSKHIIKDEHTIRPSRKVNTYIPPEQRENTIVSKNTIILIKGGSPRINDITKFSTQVPIEKILEFIKKEEERLSQNLSDELIKSIQMV